MKSHFCNLIFTASHFFCPGWFNWHHVLSSPVRGKTFSSKAKVTAWNLDLFFSCRQMTALTWKLERLKNKGLCQEHFGQKCHQGPLYIYSWEKTQPVTEYNIHDDVIKWKYFPHYWPFLRGIHRWPVNSPHKGQWRGGLTFSLICVWINGWVNNGEAGDLRRYPAHYDVTVMYNPVNKEPNYEVCSFDLYFSGYKMPIST